MGALFWLSETQCAAIEPHLPKHQPGARRVDDRRVISGHSCPEGRVPLVRLSCRVRAVDDHLQSLQPLVPSPHLGRNAPALAACDAVPKTTAIDSTYIKAQRSAFGGKGGAGASDRPLTRRPHDQDPCAHRRVERPNALTLTSGNIADVSAAPALLERAVGARTSSPTKATTHTPCGVRSAAPGPCRSFRGAGHARSPSATIARDTRSDISSRTPFAG